jgi:hypothetical protein
MMKTVGAGIQYDLKYQQFRLLNGRMQDAPSEADADWDEEFEQKREEAFEDYQR